MGGSTTTPAYTLSTPLTLRCPTRICLMTTFPCSTTPTRSICTAPTRISLQRHRTSQKKDPARSDTWKSQLQKQSQNQHFHLSTSTCVTKCVAVPLTAAAAPSHAKSQEYFPLFPQICTSRLNPKLNSFPKHMWCLLVEITKYPWKDTDDWRANVFQVKDRAENTFVLNVTIYGRENPYTVKWDERCGVGGTVVMMQARKEEKQIEIPAEVGDYMLFGEETADNIQVSLGFCGSVPMRRSHSSCSISRAVWRDLWPLEI
jgi:hypothetical protein